MRLLAAALAALAAAPAAAAAGDYQCDWRDYLPADHVPVPCVRVPACRDGEATAADFQLANATAASAFSTSVGLCQTRTHLVVRYDMRDDAFLRNDVSECNGALYNAEVGEMFLAPGAADPTHYLELELSASTGQRFAAFIDNPHLDATDMNTTYVPCADESVVHLAQPDAAEHRWTGELGAPWALFDLAERPDVWRANLFRIAMYESVDVCTQQTCEFSCWSPTHTQPPAFHHPAYFAVLDLS